MTGKLIKRAHPLHPEPAPQDWQEFKLVTQDGYKLGAWLSDAGPGSKVLIVLHGNGSCRSNHKELLKQLRSRGYTVMAVSMRCHGDSTGYINDFGLGASWDVVAALEWIDFNLPQRKSIILGRSLGAAAAIYAAKERQPDAFIFESPYSDLERACHNRLKLRLPPPLVGAALVSMRPWGKLILGYTPAAISPLRACRAVTAPCILFGAGQDRKATPEEMEEFQKQLSCKWINFPDSEHTQAYADHPERYLSEIDAFIEETFDK